MKNNSGSGTEKVHINLACLEKQTTFFWCPILNEKGRYIVISAVMLNIYRSNQRK